MTASSLPAEAVADVVAREGVDERGRPWRDVACDRHGHYRSVKWSRDVWSMCTACSDEHREREAQAKELRLRYSRQQDFLSASGLDGRFLRATFDSYAASTAKQQAVLDTCRQFADGMSFDTWRPLMLIGPAGTGKTHLGASIVRACVEVHDRRAVMTTPREIVRDLRSTWRRGAEDSEDEVLEHYGRMPLLVLDEMGVGFGSEAELVQLFEVVDMRYRLCRPSVFISNLTVAELKAVLGDRIFDRMREGAQVLACSWPSHRGCRT